MQPARTSVRASEVAGRAVALQVGWRVVGGWSTQAHACGSEWRSDGVTPSWGARGPGGTRVERGSARRGRAARLRASCDGAGQHAEGGLMGGRSGPPLRCGWHPVAASRLGQNGGEMGRLPGRATSPRRSPTFPRERLQRLLWALFFRPIYPKNPARGHISLLRPPGVVFRLKIATPSSCWRKTPNQC